ncbi:hypothetical protein [Curtobacterium luteum]|uniref:hypothetical protein n=1 Tax=Curtobacterium luteum TaxID=33881 RepID=UPI003818082A
MKRRVVTCAAVPALIVGLSGGITFLGGATATAATTGSTSIALVDSATLSSQVIVSGTLLNSAGSPVTAGSYVYLRAEPTNEALDNLSGGETAPIVAVGVAQTDATGHFDLRYSDTDSMRNFADKAGIINLDVYSYADGDLHTYSFSAVAPGVAAGDKPESVSSALKLAPSVGGKKIASLAKAHGYISALGGRPASRSASVAEATATAEPDEPGDETDDTAEPTDTAYPVYPVDSSGPNPGGGGDTTDQGGTVCGMAGSTSLGTKIVTVGEAYVSNGTTVDFGYTTGSNSSLGLAVDTGGGFKADGTSSVSSTASVDFAPYSGTGGVQFRTKFVYKKFKTQCMYSEPTYSVRATSYAGGTYPKAIAASSTPSASKCVVQKAKSVFTTNTSSATTFSAGVGISADIGINLSSHTGYSKNAQLKFSFSKDSHLCGTSDYPGGTPKRLVAKK